jgi:hypothetical protein
LFLFEIRLAHTVTPTSRPAIDTSASEAVAPAARLRYLAHLKGPQARNRSLVCALRTLDGARQRFRDRVRNDRSIDRR